nr:hypothetical protein HK105_001051 [Polyrhizophydium stewartii]
MMGICLFVNLCGWPGGRLDGLVFGEGLTDKRWVGSNLCKAWRAYARISGEVAGLWARVEQEIHGDDAAVRAVRALHRDIVDATDAGMALFELAPVFVSLAVPLSRLICVSGLDHDPAHAMQTLFLMAVQDGTAGERGRLGEVERGEEPVQRLTAGDA